LWCRLPLFFPQQGAAVLALWCRHRDSPAFTVGSAGTLHSGTYIGLPLSGRAGLSALGQERWDSPAGGIVWSTGLLCTLGKQAFWFHLQSSSLQLSCPQGGIWHSHSLMGEWRLSHCQAQWEALGLFVPQVSRSPGPHRMADYHSEKELGSHSWQSSEVLPGEGLVVSAGPPCSVGRKTSWPSRRAKCWAWGSLAYVAGGSWDWVESCKKASRFESSGAYKAAEALGSTARASVLGCFHKPWQLLQAWGTKPSDSGSPGACLLVWATRSYGSCCKLGDPNLWAAGVLGPACQVLASRSHRSCCSHREQSLWEMGVLRAACQGVSSRMAVQ
jgi:hypothetical protein